MRHWLSVRRDPGEAARVFRNPRMPPDARLAHARALFDLDPATAVDAFIDLNGDLDPSGGDGSFRAFIVNLDEVVTDKVTDEVTAQSARYLTHAVGLDRRRIIVTSRPRPRPPRVGPSVPGGSSALIGYVRGDAGRDWKTGEPLYDCAVARTCANGSGRSRWRYASTATAATTTRPSRSPRPRRTTSRWPSRFWTIWLTIVGLGRGSERPGEISGGRSPPGLWRGDSARR